MIDSGWTRTPRFVLANNQADTHSQDDAPLHLRYAINVALPGVHLRTEQWNSRMFYEMEEKVSEAEWLFMGVRLLDCVVDRDLLPICAVAYPALLSLS